VSTTLDDIARRAEALGYEGRLDGKWLRLTKMVGESMRFVTYIKQDGGGVELFSDSGICRHERAMLESDDGPMELLRKLHARLAQAEANVAEMRREVEGVTGLIAEVAP
jgi:hypothetical protein